MEKKTFRCRETTEVVIIMPTIAELLYGLKVSELRKLAKYNRIELIKIGFLFSSPATRKDDIIEVLLDSGKITKKKIEAVKKPTKPRKRTAPKRRALRAAEKTQILKRQKYKCARCKKMDLSKTVPHFDHKTPLALGGSDTLRNIQGLCGTCHAEKTQEDRLKISQKRARRRR